MSRRPWEIEWNGRDSLEDHFGRHGKEVGAKNESEYLRSARETIQLGVRLTYQIGSRERLGYYHKRTGRFTAVSGDGQSILTHSRESENYVGTLKGSTYR